MSANHMYIGPGIILTIDLFIISFGNWVFWLLVSMFTTTAEIGIATSVYSYVILFSSITMLGLEYTIIKKSSINRNFVFGTTILIKVMLLTISMPLFIFMLGYLGYPSSSQITFLAIGIFIFYSFRHVFRYILLGSFESGKILVINLVGLSSQLLIGLYLVLNNVGATGILLSFLANVFVLTVLYFIILKKKLSFTIGDKKYFMDFIKDALVNTPPILTRSLLFYFSVVLLAFYGISESDIGLFYISMMLSIIAGGFASNTALMLMPSSLVANRNLSVEGLRISFALTAPIISVLLSEPERILGIIGQQFVHASDLLVIFSLSIVPFIIVTNSLSNFNNTKQSKKIIMIGIIQFSTFLISFVTLVPFYGVTGGAYAIFVSMTISSIFSIIWYGSRIMKNISFSCLSIFIVFVLISVLNSITDIHLGFSAIIAIVSTLAINVLFKNISIFELREIIRIVIRMLRRNKIQ